MRTITIVLLLLERAAWIGFTAGRGEGQKSGGLATAGLWSLAFAVAVPAALLGHPSAGEAWAGLAVLAAGVVLRIASLRHLGRFFSELIVLREDHRLVRDGPYRVLRHPLHVGLVLMALGLALLGGGGWRFAAPALAALAAALREVREDAVLRARFGEEWTAHAARTWGLTDLWPRGPVTPSDDSDDSGGDGGRDA